MTGLGGRSVDGRVDGSGRSYLQTLRDRFGVASRGVRTPERRVSPRSNRPIATPGIPRGVDRAPTPGSRALNPVSPPSGRSGISTNLRVESDRVRDLRRRFGLPDPAGRKTDLPRLDPAAPVGADPRRGGTTPPAASTPRRGRPLERPDGTIVFGSGRERPGVSGTPGRGSGGKRGGIVAPGLDKGRLGERLDRRGKIVADGLTRNGRGGRGGGGLGGPSGGTGLPGDPGGLGSPGSAAPPSELRNALSRVAPPVPGGPAPTPGVDTSVIVFGSNAHYPRYFHHPWYHYPYVTIGYPYYGYYSHYGYPYLYGYGCDFYSGFYLRFGHFRFGLYSCYPYFGHYGHYGHHHRHYCSHHGYYHFYRLRDCHLCYDSSPDYTIYETVIYEGPEAEEKVQSLAPGELSFCEGWVHLKSGDYQKAAEAFYNASVEIESSGVINLYLGIALAGMGEYALAGSAFEEAYRLTPSLVGARWDVAAHFGSRERFDDYVATAEQYVAVAPNENGAWLALAVVNLLTNEREGLDKARAAAGEIAKFTDGGAFARAIAAEAVRRDLGEEVLSARLTPPTALTAWLLAPACESIGTLGLGSY